MNGNTDFNDVLNSIPNMQLVSHKESINHTPISDCEWKTFLGTEGERGISRCYPTDKERIDILKKYGTDHVKYDIYGEPNFGTFAETEVKISNMSDVRQGKEGNFRSAAEKLLDSDWAKERGLNSAIEIENYRKEHKLVWHEKRDGITMQLVPQEVHEKFTHLGGVSIMSHLINEEGLSVCAVKIKLNQATVKLEEKVQKAATGKTIQAAAKGMKSGGVYSLTYHGIDNTVAFLQGQKEFDEAIVDTVFVTAKSAAEAGVISVADVVVQGGIQKIIDSEHLPPQLKSRLNNMLDNKYTGVCIALGASIAKSTGKLMDGEITLEEFADEVVGNTTSIAIIYQIGMLTAPYGLVVSAAVNYVVAKIMATINSWIDKIDTPEKRARRIATYRMIAKQAEEESKVLIKLLSEAQNQYEKNTSSVLEQLELAKKTQDIGAYGNAIQKLCESYDTEPQFLDTDSVKKFVMTPGSSLVLGDKIECYIGQ